MFGLKSCDSDPAPKLDAGVLVSTSSMISTVGLVIKSLHTNVSTLAIINAHQFQISMLKKPTHHYADQSVVHVSSSTTGWLT